MTPRDAALDLLIAFGAFVLIHIILGGFLYYLMENYWPVHLMWIVVPLGLATLIFVGIVLRIRRQSMNSIGLRKPLWVEGGVGALLALPACFAATITVGFYYTAFFGFENVMEDRQAVLEFMPEPSIWSFLIIGPFTGLHEEVFFRGFILTRMVALFRSKIAAVIVSSVLFGLPHIYQGLSGVCQTTAIGLVLATLVMLTRSLWPAIIVHGLFNSIQLAMLPLLREFLEGAVDQLTTAPAA